MSKSKDNVIDPLPVMDELGTDALRFTLLVGSTPGNDINLDVKRVEANRNFANKIWNAGRFVIGAINNAPKIGGKSSGMEPGRFLDLGTLQIIYWLKPTGSLKIINLERRAGRFMNSSGVILPIGTSR